MIEKFIETLKEMNATNIREIPNVRALLLLADGFFTEKISTKYLGKVKIDVNENFFKDEEKAKEIIKLFCRMIGRIKTMLEEEFGEDSEKILADLLPTMSLSYNM